MSRSCQTHMGYAPHPAPAGCRTGQWLCCMSLLRPCSAPESASPSRSVIQPGQHWPSPGGPPVPWTAAASRRRLTVHAEENRAIFDLYNMARSAALPGDGTKRGSEFTAEYSPGDRPVAVILLPALFVGDWLWDPVWTALTAAGWPVVRFRESASLIDR